MERLEDQHMKKIHSLALATAGALAASAVAAHATTIVENFAEHPAGQGWLPTGNTNLFLWDATNQNLRVKWDSSQSNSYFCRPFGATLTKATDFLLSFDLRLSDIGPGVDTNKTFTFQIAIGLV